MLETIASGVHVLEGPQSFLGVPLGARMTVLEVEDGTLIHSPVRVEPASLAHLSPRWVLAPNLFHHLHAGAWIDAGVPTWGAPGLDEKRADLDFHGVVDSTNQPFGRDVQLFPLRCFPMSNEVVVHHRPSRTLVVTDLVFNLGPSTPWRTRAAMRCVGGYPGCRCTLLERGLMRRDVARRELGELIALDFDRLVMSHGDVIESGGPAALANAFRWLGV